MLALRTVTYCTENEETPENATEATLADRRSSPERVVDAVTRGVLRRQYLVGHRLVESELTEQLGVSRSTVREALKILAASGVVEIVPHRGALVRALSLADARDLLSVLEVLIGLAARQAAQRISEGDNRAAFKAAAEALISPRPNDQLERILDERAKFYQVIFDIAGNRELDRALPLPRANLLRTQFYGFLSKSDLKAMIAEYHHITTAILDGDAAAAERHSRRHIQKTAERSLPHLR